MVTLGDSIPEGLSTEEGALWYEKQDEVVTALLNFVERVARSFE